MSIVRIALLAGAAAGLSLSCAEQVTTVDDARPVASTAVRAEQQGAAPRTPSVPRRATTLEQPAVWPAADVVLATPEEAAGDFVRNVFGDHPEVTLGEFAEGDSRSGEIDVIYSGDEVTRPNVVSTLLLRRLAPHDGWFVLAGVNETATIRRPTPGAVIPPRRVRVAGVASGFESTVLVSAFPAGDGTRLDLQVTGGGVFEPEPYTATLDLSAAPPGVTAVMVRGDVPLTNHPGNFSVIPIVLGLPGTR